MTVPIAIRTGAATEGTAAPAPGGVRLVLPIRRGVGGTSSIAPTIGAGTTALKPSLNAERLALAVAAAVDDPSDALYLVRQARNKPDKALGQRFDTGKVAEILAAIRAAQETPSKEIEITDPVRAAAVAVGANVRLVAAAAELMRESHSDAPADPDPTKNSLGWNGRRWAINLVDPAVIDRAVRAFLRARALEVVTAGEDLRNLQRAVEKITAKVTNLETTDVKVLERLNTLEGKVDGAVAPVGAGAGGGAKHPK